MPYRENFIMTACPGCTDRGSRLVESVDIFSLYQCIRCGLQFWDPTVDPNKVWYENDLFYSIRNELIPETLATKYRLFLNARSHPGGELIDIGCGTGMFAARCRDKGYSVTGIDFNVHSVSVAKNLWGLENVYSLSLDEFVSKYPDRRFDVITFFEVLEHQQSPIEFLIKVKGLLNPGGFIALSIPNRERWELLPPMNDYPPNHLTRWNVDALKGLLGSEGFVVEEIVEVPFSIESARQVLSGRLNSLKNKVLMTGMKKVSSVSSSGSGIRSLFKAVFLAWRAFLFVPSAVVYAYAKIASKKDFSIYCLARIPERGGV